MLNRHQARAFAFQALFMIAGNPDLSVDQALQEVLTNDRDQRQDAVEETPVILDLSDPNQAYLEQLTTGVLTHATELDAALAPKLKRGWSLPRLSKTDLLILRLGLYELQHEAEVPDAVAIRQLSWLKLSVMRAQLNSSMGCWLVLSQPPPIKSRNKGVSH